MEYLPIVRYLVVFAILTVIGAPLAALLFQDLPRKGAAFALPTVLIPFAIIVFWVGQITFGLHTLVFGVAVLAAGALIAYRHGARPEWRAVAAMYGVFMIGFSILVVFRTVTPSITATLGEQFLHFGLVNALERAPSLPPEDMWYAGEPLQYYYGTQLQVTSFAMLTGTHLRYGFNLGIAAFYGVLFVVAYGLAGAIVANQGYSARLGGILGIAFVALGGGTTTAIRLATPHLPDGIADMVVPAAFGFVADRFNGGDLAQTVTGLSNPFEWTWWYTRYVVPGTIQEVPLYSFIKADLHGHALSPGFVLFAGGVAYAYYLAPADARRRRAALLFGGLGAIAGVFGFMNTWALPTAGGLAFLAVGAADAHPATVLPERYRTKLQLDVEDIDSPYAVPIAELWRLGLAAIAAMVVVLVGIAIASPFLLFGDVPTNEGIGFFPPRSPLGPFLVIYGGLLALFATYLGVRAWPVLVDLDRRVLAGGAVAVLVAMVVLTLWLDFAVLAVTGPLLLGAWLLVRSNRGDFALVLLIAGVGLLLSFEVIHARLPQIAEPRWNTSLKVAVQGWTLGAAGAGGAAAILLARSGERLASVLPSRSRTDGLLSRHRTDGGDGESPPRWAALPASVTVGIVAVVLATSLVFPGMAFGQEVGAEIAANQYEPTLDGFSNLERWRPKQAAAIGWLDARSGTPTIVEAPGPAYRWNTLASTFTGLPTVIGWDHQEEYRSPEAYARRVARVDEIYTGEWSLARSHLARYDVKYVYVGPTERERYGDELRSFDRPAFTVVFENEAVTIYEVDETHLP